MDNKLNVSISPNVLKDIIKETLKETEGVCGVYKFGSSNVYKDVKNFFKSQPEKIVEVEIGGQECVIDLKVTLLYGYNIKSVTERIKENVTNKIKEMTDINVKELNITVEKIVRDEKENCEGVN